jgi:hypothetical protein
MLANGRPTAFHFDTFATALQNAIGQGGKSDVRLAKCFVREKLSKKVQFLQPNNDDMMKKVYDMAQKYMNYDADDFSSVWTKVVLPTIKRSGYAVAIKNRVIRGKVLVMNSTEFVIRNGTVAFSLENQLITTMIAEKRKGDF